jgi:hypothetical protein
MAEICILLTITAGLFFYWLRCRFQLLYGLCEILVAVVVIHLTFLPAAIVLGTGAVSFASLLMSKAVGIIGGIYILVRGMDNIDKDLPPKWRRVWDCVFPKRVVTAIPAA